MYLNNKYNFLWGKIQLIKLKINKNEEKEINKLKN